MSEKFQYDGREYTLPTPNGIMFHSRASNYQFIVRGATPKYDHGIKVGEERELVAEFGDPSPVQQYDESTGDSFVQTRGHYCHTLEQGKKKEWTDDERALVEKALLVNQSPSFHWMHEAPPAVKPWPNYDDTEPGKVAEIAVATGTVAEALAYERENKKRPTVIGALKKASEQDVESVEEELAAA